MSHRLQAHGSSSHSVVWPSCPLRTPRSGCASGQQCLGWLGAGERPWYRRALGSRTRQGPELESHPPHVRCGNPVGHIPSSNWLPVIMCCCCVQRCGWEPWLGWIPSFKGKRNKMSLFVLKEAAIINVICLDFKFRRLPKSLCG